MNLQKMLTVFSVVVLCLTFTVNAQMDFGLKSVGARISYVNPEGINSTIGFGGVVVLGSITPVILIEGNLDFWSKSYTSGDVKSSFRDIAVGATAKYVFPLGNQAIKPFASGGVAFHILKSEVDIPETTFYGQTFGGKSSVTDSKIGIDIGGGAAYAASDKVDVTGQLHYRIVSDFSQFVLSIGALVHL